MPRKPKSVYTRIEEKTAQINKLKEKISICETELIALNKERTRVPISKGGVPHGCSGKQPLQECVLRTSR